MSFDFSGTYTLKEGHIVQLNKMVDENYGAFMSPGNDKI
jgi:hypothetical protein